MWLEDGVGVGEVVVGEREWSVRWQTRVGGRVGEGLGLGELRGCFILVLFFSRKS
jgi:hypothetical protein